MGRNLELNYSKSVIVQAEEGYLPLLSLQYSLTLSRAPAVDDTGPWRLAALCAFILKLTLVLYCRKRQAHASDSCFVHKEARGGHLAIKPSWVFRLAPNKN